MILLTNCLSILASRQRGVPRLELLRHAARNSGHSAFLKKATSSVFNHCRWGVLNCTASGQLVGKQLGSHWVNIPDILPPLSHCLYTTT